MASPTILQLGDPRLRQVAQPVGDVRSPEVQALIDQLLVTVSAKSGVGIAAPQIAQALQIMIVASHPSPRYPQAPEMAPMAMINPQIVEMGGDRIFGWEGCLSVPDQRGFVPRYGKVTIAYTDRQGLGQTIVFQDFLARIFQHEYDHFQGILFPDRVESPEHLISEAAYQEMIQKPVA
ncbi:MAG: peptide deformylase [Alkalinema sp. RU_4_3]|nr:peptide deformylase [Alkalinema sp. RU_4_3]